MTSEPKKRKIGRPRKDEVLGKLPRKPGRPPGRPKGDAGILAEYKARMLASPQSRKVLQKVFDIALDDEHHHQVACLKLVLDRIAPVGAFEADIKKGAVRNAIQINISGLEPKSTVNTVEGEVISED